MTIHLGCEGDQTFKVSADICRGKEQTKQKPKSKNCVRIRKEEEKMEKEEKKAEKRYEDAGTLMAKLLNYYSGPGVVHSSH